MKNEFIPYEQAVELKELGFDELCIAGYDKDFISKLYIGFSTDDGALFNTEYYILAPLYQQAFRWFRDKYDLNGLQFIYQTMDSGYALQSMEEDDQTDGYFNTYEEAELACLKKLIEIAKK